MPSYQNIFADIVKGVHAKQTIHAKAVYECENQKDAEAIADNITKMLHKHLEDLKLAKITYEYKLDEKIVEIEVIQHK